MPRSMRDEPAQAASSSIPSVTTAAPISSVSVLIPHPTPRSPRHAPCLWRPQMKTRSALTEPAQPPAADDGVLVDAGWLDAHLHDPAVRVVEVDVSRRAHDEWHIDGAVLWDIYRDLKDADYQLIGTAATERLLVRSGIGPGSTI